MNKKGFLLLLCILTFSLFQYNHVNSLVLTPSGQHSWPMLHHDASHQGNTLLTGPEDATIIAPWPFHADAPIRSAPVVGKDGTAYFGADDGNLYAVRQNAPDTPGLIKWRFPAVSSGDKRISGAPALKEDPEGSPVRVYFATDSGEVYSLNARDGSVVWHHSLGKTVNSSPVLYMPLGTGLVRLYLRVEDKIYLFEETGAASMPTVNVRSLYAISQNSTNATSVTLSPSGSKLYATDGEKKLYFLDAINAREVCPSIVLSNTNSVTTPVVDSAGNIYFGTSAGELFCFPPSPTGMPPTCREVWKLTVANPIMTAPAIASDNKIIFVSGNTVYAADRVNGILAGADCWRYTAPWIYSQSSPVIDGAGTVFLSGNDSHVYAVNRNGTGGKELWSVNVTSGSMTVPAIDSVGRLYVGSTDNNLYVLQDDPAFKVAFDSTKLSRNPNTTDVHTLREKYGQTDPARLLRVTDHSANDGEPTYSTDGRWMAFISDRDGKQDVFLGTSGGQSLRNLSGFIPSCNPIVTGDKSGVNGTTHNSVFDKNLSTFFKSSYDNWQYVQIDFNCVGEFSGFRRYMTRDGVDTTGYRVFTRPGRLRDRQSPISAGQGESVSYSLDGVNWTKLTARNTNGWENYVNYSADTSAWHSVVYGWSAWLHLNMPVQARFIRFLWDDNRDALNEVEVSFTEPSPPFPQGANVTEPCFSPTRLDGTSPLNDGKNYLATTVDIDVKRIRFVDLSELLATDQVKTLDLRSWLQRQYRDPSVTAHPDVAPLVTNSEQSQVAFSSDGNKMAYSSCRFITLRDGSPGHINELVLFSLSGRYIPGSTPLIAPVWVISSEEQPGPCSESPADFAPAFSPDSRYLVYQREGSLIVHNLQTRAEIKIEPSGLTAKNPYWSPDGTEIVFTGTNAGTLLGETGLYVAKGPRYQEIVSTSAPFVAGPRTVFDDAEYHPIQSPEPRASLDCAAEIPSPLLLQPQVQQPRSTIEVRGCGFDIKFPGRNQVFFRHAKYRENPTRWVQASVLGARVDVEMGLGVLVVTVPDLAGDGPVMVTTPFGQTTIPGFRVIPLPLALLQPRSIPGAKIRILGYGFQITDTTHTRKNRVFFTGPGDSSLEANVEATAQRPCGTPETPCPALAPLYDGERQVEWLEVIVPPGVVPGNVRVTNDDINEKGEIGPFGLLNPNIELSRDNGCEGCEDEDDHTKNIPAVTFEFIGTEFPYDTYFQYTTVHFLQKENGSEVAIDCSAIQLDGSERILGNAQIRPATTQDGAGEFVSTVPVASNAGGKLTMIAEDENSHARACKPFTTPLSNLPIIFVPGTSGTFITNKSWQGFTHGFCPGMQILDAGHSLRNDVGAGEDVWINGHGIQHIVIGCDGWLDPTKLNPRIVSNDDGLPHPDFRHMDVGRVISRVDVPPGFEDEIDPEKAIVYELLINFITGPGTQEHPGMNRPLGDPDTNLWPANGLYLFNLDWRKSFSSQAERLSLFVQSILDHVYPEDTSPVPASRRKVVIITQSVGGPVTQYYLRSPQYNAASKVDQVISLGGGFMGVVKPYKILQMGDDWGLQAEFKGIEIGVDPEKIQELSLDWPTAYWQLPQSAWFDDPNNVCPGDNCAYIQEDGWDADEDRVIEGFLANTQASYDFIRNSKAGPDVNLAKFNFAVNHLLSNPPGSRALGDWRGGTDGIFFHRVVGSGVPTVNRLRYFTREEWRFYPVATIFTGFLLIPILVDVEEIEPIMLNGDGTIPLRSAVGILDSFDDRIWGLDGVEHLPIAKNEDVFDLIRNMTNGKVCSLTQRPGPFTWSVPGNPLPSQTHFLTSAGTGEPAARVIPPQETSSEWWKVSVLGRRSLHIYDKSGRHVGPANDNPKRLEKQIPDVIYERGPTSTYAYLPKSEVYTLGIKASNDKEQQDAMDLKISLMRNFENVQTVTFLGIPLAPTTTGTLKWDGVGPPDKPVLEMDFAGDGKIYHWQADAILKGPASQDTQRPTTTIQVRNGILTLNADDSGGAGVHKIIYGFDRAQTVANFYTEPVRIPPDTRYVWAFAVDRAGNTQYPFTIYDQCDDCKGATVAPTEDLTTSENGRVTFIKVALNAKPTAEVTIPIRSSNPNEGTVSPSQLVFTPKNAKIPKTVKIKGVNDQEKDGDVKYTIVLEPAKSDDSRFNGLDLEDVKVINRDND